MSAVSLQDALVVLLCLAAAAVLKWRQRKAAYPDLVIEQVESRLGQHAGSS